MAQFYLDTDCLTEAQRQALEGALAPLAEADTPLCVELLTVSAEEMRALNGRQRGIDRVTDVLSFPALDSVEQPLIADEHGEELDEEGRLLLGSVVVCKERAEEQAEEYGHGYEREFFYLTVHGVLHCLGYDHETEEEKAEMRAREEEVMKRLGLERNV